MKIAFTDIQNFRKLKNCRVVLSEQKTIFVGANNSGKTSAMDALIIFMKHNHREFSVRDFTLSNWKDINQIASDWVDTGNGNEPDLSPDIWRPLMPSLDVWLEVEDKEVHYVSHIIPTLDWAGGKLGIRLVLEPNNTEELYKAFKAAHGSAEETCGAADSSLKLWPKSMRDFLEKELHKFFTINAYILDHSKAAKHEPQLLTNRSEPLDGDPFKGLFKINIII